MILQLGYCALIWIAKSTPGNTRHCDIRYDQIGGIRASSRQRLERTGEELRGETIHPQYGGETGRNDRFIIDDKNA
jgi:hypothetical protein